MNRKITALFVSILLAFQLIGIEAYAEDDLFKIYSGDVYYTLDDAGVLTVYSKTGYYSDSYTLKKYEDQIKKIVITDTVTYIDSQAFDGCQCEVDLVLPAALQTIDGYAFARCPGFTVKLDEKNPYFKLVDGILYSADMTQLVYASPTLTGDFTVPDSVTTVCDGAFVYSRFESITIPDTVTKMVSHAGRNAEAECQLAGRVFAYALAKKITIGRNVELFDRCLIYRCPNLEKLIIRGTDTEFEPNETEQPFVIDDNQISTVYVQKNSKAEKYMQKYYGGKWDYIREISADNLTAKCGDTVKFPIRIEQEIGFSDLSIEIGYDSDALELAEVEENKGIGATFTKAEFLNTNPYNMNWASTANTKYSGTLVTLYFKVKTKKPGIYPISVDFYKGRDGNYTDGNDVNYDENFEAINLLYSSGSITVISSGESSGGSMVVSGISFTVKLAGDTSIGNVYAAIYDASGRLKNLKQYPAADSVKIEFDAGVTGSYVKIMWWDDNMKPMCKAQNIPLQ